MRFQPLFLILLLVGPTACRGLSKIDITSTGRDRWQRPAVVIELMELSPGDRVADIGSGEGYFLPHLSNAVGPDGRVYAVEVDEELIEALQSWVEAESLGNVEVILGAYDDPKLPNGSVDRVLIVNTYHHIEDHPAYFEGLAGDLSERGRVTIIEPDEELSGVLSLFLDEGHTSVEADVVSEMHRAGYSMIATSDQLPVQILVTFEPAPAGH